jgi:hypothetical protein
MVLKSQVVKRSNSFLKRFIAQTVHTVCTRIKYKVVVVINIYTMVQVELNNIYIYIYIYIGANNGSENKIMNKEKNTATSGKLIKAVYASYGNVYNSSLYNSCLYKWNEILICSICGRAGNVLHKN